MNIIDETVKNMIADMEESLCNGVSNSIFGTCTEAAPTVFNRRAIEEAIRLVNQSGPMPDWIKCIRYSKKNRKAFYEWTDKNHIIHTETPGIFLPGFDIFESAYIPAGRMIVEFNSGKIGLIDVSTWEVEEDQQ